MSDSFSFRQYKLQESDNILVMVDLDLLLSNDYGFSKNNAAYTSIANMVANNFYREVMLLNRSIGSMVYKDFDDFQAELNDIAIKPARVLATVI